MKKLIIIISFFSFLSLFAQEGIYKVGNTTCTIESSHTYYKVYWENGTGYTSIIFKEQYPNGNEVFDEYDYKNNESIYVGSFIFKNDYYQSGIYIRDDGKEFKIKKLYR